MRLDLAGPFGDEFVVAHPHLHRVLLDALAGIVQDASYLASLKSLPTEPSGYKINPAILRGELPNFRKGEIQNRLVVTTPSGCTGGSSSHAPASWPAHFIHKLMSTITQADDLTLLEALIVDNPDLERLEALLEQFNIFEALGVVWVELRHSDFLAFPLNPRQSHGLGKERRSGLGEINSGLP